MIFFILITSLTSWSSVNSPSGHEWGNGGDAVVCSTILGKSVKLYDLYEGDLLKQGPWLHVQKPESETLMQDYYQLIQEKTFGILSAWDQQPLYDFFQNNARYLKNIRLDNYPDEGFVVLPSNCNLQQVAIQNLNLDIFNKKIVIQYNLLLQLSKQHRAFLFLHELIQSLSGPANVGKSLMVRSLVREVASTYTTYKNPWDLIESLKRRNFLFPFAGQKFWIKTENRLLTLYLDKPIPMNALSFSKGPQLNELEKAHKTHPLLKSKSNFQSLVFDHNLNLIEVKQSL